MENFTSDIWVLLGLRALLRFMTGIYVCMNRGDVDVRATQVQYLYVFLMNVTCHSTSLHYFSTCVCVIV